MKTISRKSSTGLLAVGVALLMPFAFAQNEQAIPPPHNGTMQEGAKDPTPNTPNANTAADSASKAATATAENAKSWKELDVNKDGKLSRDEAASDTVVAANFDSIDTDKDGTISRAEYKKYRADQDKIAKVDSKK